MRHTCGIIGGLTIAGLLLGTASGIEAAEMPMDHTATQGEFQRLEQPLEIKLGVAAGGLFLIGLELWWFLATSPKPNKPH